MFRVLWAYGVENHFEIDIRCWWCRGARPHPYQQSFLWDVAVCTYCQSFKTICRTRTTEVSCRNSQRIGCSLKRQQFLKLLKVMFGETCTELRDELWRLYWINGDLSPLALGLENSNYQLSHCYLCHPVGEEITEAEERKNTVTPAASHLQIFPPWCTSADQLPRHVTSHLSIIQATPLFNIVQWLTMHSSVLTQEEDDKVWELGNIWTRCCWNGERNCLFHMKVKKNLDFELSWVEF